MSELENEIENEVMEDQVEEVEEVKSEQDEPSDLAPDSETEHEENAEEDEHRVNQEKIQQVINKKHREMMEAKEEADRLRKQLEQFNSQQKQDAAPEILPAPDPFDDDYDSKIKARDESIQRRAQWEAENAQRQQAQQRQQEELQRAQVEQVRSQMESYTAKAKSYGITNEELQSAANIVGQSGLSDDIALAILADEEGPLITKYLAANQLEAYDIAQMSPIQAAQYLERKVRPKLAALKPKQSSAPKPPTRTKQVVGDAELGKYKHLGGAKFE